MALCFGLSLCQIWNIAVTVKRIISCITCTCGLCCNSQLDVTAKLIGSTWLIQSIIAIIFIIRNNIEIDEIYSKNKVYYPFSCLFKGSPLLVILVCLHLSVHCIASLLVVYGACKGKRFYLLLWLIQAPISTIINVSMLAKQWDYFYNEEFQMYYVVTTVLQILFSIPIIRHFLELKKEAKEKDSFVVVTKCEIPYIILAEDTIAHI